MRLEQSAGAETGESGSEGGCCCCVEEEGQGSPAPCARKGARVAADGEGGEGGSRDEIAAVDAGGSDWNEVRMRDRVLVPLLEPRAEPWVWTA